MTERYEVRNGVGDLCYVFTSDHPPADIPESWWKIALQVAGLLAVLFVILLVVAAVIGGAVWFLMGLPEAMVWKIMIATWMLALLTGMASR